MGLDEDALIEKVDGSFEGCSWLWRLCRFHFGWLGNNPRQRQGQLLDKVCEILLELDLGIGLGPGPRSSKPGTGGTPGP